MPTPRKDEKQEDFIGRCIPYVMKEGTAKDNKQATAFCNSIWRRAKGIKDEPPEKKSAIEYKEAIS